MTVRQLLPRIAQVAAIVALVVLVVGSMGYFFLPKVAVAPKHEPDWAAVWTMRWMGVSAVFTGLSWLAIALTALYAQHAISVSAGIERSKLARELLEAYRSREIEKALRRCKALPHDQYSREEFIADLDRVIVYYEECSLYYEVNSVNRELLLRFLDVKIVSTWRALAEIVFPYLQRTEKVGAMQFPRLREFAELAQQHLIRRKDITASPELLESLP